MGEKQPAFVVVDRRKFTAEGDIRDTYTPPPEETPAASVEPAASEDHGHILDHHGSPNVISMPARSTVEAADIESAEDAIRQDLRSEEELAAGYDVDGDGPSSDEEAFVYPEPDELNDENSDAPPPPTAAETASQQAAYRKSSREMDALLRQANPGMKATAAVGFEHIVQSFYMSAIMAMGAGTEPGQKPRIDILGARQAIDMLSVLADKTRGNLDDKEQRLVDGVAFELRMMFLELTNAIAAQAQQAPPGRR